jgi:hypothetical protein
MPRASNTTDPTAEIVEALTSVPAGEILRVTYQADGSARPRNYYGFIEGVGVSKAQSCAFFTLKTAEGTKTFLCNERLRRMVAADSLVEAR